MRTASPAPPDSSGFSPIPFERLLAVPLPPLPEQQAIAEALDGVESAIDLARTHVQSLKLAKASVADALLTGRVRVVGK